MTGPTPDGDGADALFVSDGARLDARTRFGPPGTGLAESAPWDQRGRISRALPSLYIEQER